MSKLNIKSVQVIDCNDWDRLVKETYGRPYSFQQQDDCKERGVYGIGVPAPTDDYYERFDNDTVPEKVNGAKMGVSLKAWLARDPKQKFEGEADQSDFSLELWWERNFYPHVEELARDMCAKGLIETGNYSIDVDW